MKCNECENDTEELEEYGGRQMCPECMEYEVNEYAWAEALRRDSAECDEPE